MSELIKEISFGKLDDKGMAMPHLLDIQTRAFEALLQLDAASHDREDIGLERLKQSFVHPPDDARILMRWWWFGPAVNKPELERELHVMKDVGEDDAVEVA